MTALHEVFKKLAGEQTPKQVMQGIIDRGLNDVPMMPERPVREPVTLPPPETSQTERVPLDTEPEPRFGNSFMRGVQSVQNFANVAGLYSGIISPDTAFSAISKNRQEMGLYPMDEATKQGFDEIGQAEGIYEALQAWVRNPRAALALVGETLPQLFVQIPATVAGGLAGTPGGPLGQIAGASAATGLTSGLMDATLSLLDSLEEQGFDVADEESLRKAFADEDVMAKAEAYAVKRGAAIGMVDAITLPMSVGFARKAIKPMTGGKVKKAAKRVGLAGAALGTEALGGATGEAIAQFAVDEYDPGDIVGEAIAEILMGAGEVASAIRTPKSQRKEEVPEDKTDETPEEPPETTPEPTEETPEPTDVPEETPETEAPPVEESDPEEETPKPVGKVKINEPAVITPDGTPIDAHPRHEQTGTVSDNQDGVPDGMVRVVFEDGGEDIIDVNSTEPVSVVDDQEVDENPTDPQKDKGNYKKGHIKLFGYDVTIENKVGSTRKGKDRDGTEWEVEMPADYGYIRRTEGNDGDHVDVYVGPMGEEGKIFVVDQVDSENKEFDEHKVIVGVPDELTAEELYYKGFSDGKGPQRNGGITELTADQFKKWIDEGDKSTPISGQELPVPDDFNEETEPIPTTVKDQRLDELKSISEELDKLPEMIGTVSEGKLDDIIGNLKDRKLNSSAMPGIDHEASKAMHKEINKKLKQIENLRKQKPQEEITAAVDMELDWTVGNEPYHTVVKKGQKITNDILDMLDKSTDTIVVNLPENTERIKKGEDARTILKQLNEWIIEQENKKESKEKETKPEKPKKEEEQDGKAIQATFNKVKELADDLESGKRKPDDSARSQDKKLFARYEKQRESGRMSYEMATEIGGQFNRIDRILNKKEETTETELPDDVFGDEVPVDNTEMDEETKKEVDEVLKDMEKTSEKSDYLDSYLKTLDKQRELGYAIDVIHRDDEFAIVKFDSEPVEHIKDNFINYSMIVPVEDAEPNFQVFDYPKPSKKGNRFSQQVKDLYKKADKVFKEYEAKETPEVKEKEKKKEETKEPEIKEETPEEKPKRKTPLKDLPEDVRTLEIDAEQLREPVRQFTIASKEPKITPQLYLGFHKNGKLSFNMEMEGYVLYDEIPDAGVRVNKDVFVPVDSETLYDPAKLDWRDKGYLHKVHGTINIGFDQDSSGSSLIIRQNKSMIRLKGRGTLPSFSIFGDSKKKGKTLKIDGKKISSIISKQAESISADESRYYLKGVKVAVEDGEATFASTNGNVLVATKTKVETDDNFEFIIPQEVIRVIKTYKDHDSVEITLRDGIIEFKNGMTVKAIAIDGEFPDYRKLFTEPNYTATFNKVKLKNAISAAAKSTGRYQKVTVAVDKGKAIVSTDDPIRGKAEIEIAAEASEGDMLFHFAKKNDPTKFVTGKNITIGTLHKKDTRQALNIQDDSDGVERRIAIMPMHGEGYPRNNEDGRKDPKVVKNAVKRAVKLLEKIKSRETEKKDLPKLVEEGEKIHKIYDKHKDSISEEHNYIFEQAFAQMNWELKLKGQKQIGKTEAIESGLLPQIEALSYGVNKEKDESQTMMVGKNDLEWLEKTGREIQRFLRLAGAPIKFMQGASSSATMQVTGGGVKYTVRIEDEHILDRALGMEVIGHEVGHVLYWHFFKNLNEEDKKAVRDDYAKFIKAVDEGESTHIGLGPEISKFFDRLEARDGKEIHWNYHKKFVEWFANRTAKYIAENAESPNPVKRFFERIIKALKKLFNRTAQKDRGFDDWLNDWTTGRFTPTKGGGIFNKLPPSVPTYDPFHPIGDAIKWSWMDKFRKRVQQFEIYMRRVQEAIEKVRGKKLPESQDVVQQIALYDGQIDYRMKQLKDKFITPISDLIVKYGITLNDIDEFLYARHAEERDKFAFKRDPQNPTGSGMPSSVRDKILEKWQGNKEMAEIVKIVDDMILSTRKGLLKEGLIDRKTYKNWTGMFKHYVPLRGWQFDPNEESSTGKGYSVFGREAKQILGRTSIAYSPLTYAVKQAREYIVRSQKNRVGVAFYELAKSNKDSDMWVIAKMIPKRRLNKETGQVERYYARPSPWASNANYFMVKLDGQEKWIEVKDDELFDVLQRTGMTLEGAGIRILHKIMGSLAALNTKWNPEFVFITNFTRDIQTGVINSMDIPEISGMDRINMIREAITWKQIRKIWKALRKGDSDDPYVEIYNRFVKAGGQTGWAKLYSLEETSKELMQEFNSGTAAKRIRAFNQFVEDIATGVENGVRLSLFSALIKKGLSDERAAYFAKELTVNFNKKGTWSPVVNLMYLFFNASMQGSMRVLKALGHRKVQFAVGGIVALSAMTYLWNEMVSGMDDDDDNEWQNVPDWIKERNMVFMLPNSKAYITIPMPYVYNAFWALGNNFMDIAYGRKDPIDAAWGQFSATVGSLNPLGSAPTVGQFVSPTFIDPFMQISENKSWHGGPVAPKKFDENQPDVDLHFDSVNDGAEWFADVLSQSTGGDIGKAGFIDISPESVEHLAEFAGGGIVRFGNNLFGRTVKDAVLGEDIDVRHVPFMRVLYGGTDNIHSLRAQFREAYEAVRGARYRLNAIKSSTESKEDRRDAFQVLVDEEIGNLKMFKMFNKTSTRLSEYRKKREAALTLPKPDQRTVLKKIQHREKIMLEKTLQSYNIVKQRLMEQRNGQN